MKYKIGEVVEARSQCGRYEGWRETTVIKSYEAGKFVRGSRAEYRVENIVGGMARMFTTERYMRRKSDSNDASGDSYAEMMKGLGIGEKA